MLLEGVFQFQRIVYENHINWNGKEKITKQMTFFGKFHTDYTECLQSAGNLLTA